MDQERERFKLDYLVDYLHSHGRAETPRDLVRGIGELIKQANLRFPRHAPIDAAYLAVRDGELPT